ncbi:MAG: PHB depolymerase family esterase [Candidatus Eremiobacteraeota bacterium]|nr:PHB depolymerase family esterase [Candidatus Eremiobacteraeota bacterium]
MPYRLTLPQGAANGGAPLIVALHGCKQTAKSFAVGTRLDEVAAQYGAAVLYPEQTKAANPSGCWNWFLPEHQRRERGEPAAILRLVEEVSRRHPIDANRIFVVGLSAGASMAAILGEQAPDVFAGTGIVAGVALHRSHDVASAFAAMGANDNLQRSTTPVNFKRIGLGNLQPSRLMTAVPVKTPSGLSLFAPAVSKDNGLASQVAEVSAAPALPPWAYQRLRATIWTGVDDLTVAPANARALANQFLTLLGLPAIPAIARIGECGATITSWKDAAGKVRVELWSVPKMGHGWSGGSPKGSYTFAQGPDASAHMLQYFLST